jgi:hypothetical protein
LLNVFCIWQEARKLGVYFPGLLSFAPEACTKFMIIKRLLLLVSIVLVCSSTHHATTVERLELDDLVKKAHRIVLGKVQSKRTVWSPNGKLIFTNYTVEVHEVMKGQTARTIELTTIGGQIGDLILHVAGMPVFEQGESTVLFVENNGAFSTVVGLGQGKFTIQNEQVFNSVTDLSFADGRPARSMKMPLQAFKEKVKYLINHQP